MGITAYTTVTAKSAALLDTAVAAQIALGNQPFGGARWNESLAQYEQAVSTSTATLGVVPGAVATTVTAVETTGGATNQTTLTLTAMPLTMADATQGGGVKIFTFPAGRICRIGAEASIAVTVTSVLASTLNTGVTCNYGVGSTTQASATVATTEQDIVNVTAWTAPTTINVANTAAAGVGPGVLASLDGRVTPIAAFLNLAVAGATDIDGDATVLVTGTVKITWVNIGL